MFFWDIYAFPENLSSIHQELSKVLIYELSNQTLFPALWTTCGETCPIADFNV